MKRRRFLQICAAGIGAGLPIPARAADWVGRGFGSDLSLTLAGDGDRQAVLRHLPQLIAGIESEFSLYDQNSALSRLNKAGVLEPSPVFQDLLGWVDSIFQMTGEVFDPSVQSLWESLTYERTAAKVGWRHVRRQAQRITLPPHMALTFNGIAQGFAADAVRALLAANGFGEALIDMGEYHSLGGPWRIGLADPGHGLLGENRITNCAVATSSPMATLVAGKPHLIHPRGLPALWSTVSVEADQATLADGLSTAAVFLSRDELSKLLRCETRLHRITVVDFSGNLLTLFA